MLPCSGCDVEHDDTICALQITLTSHAVTCIATAAQKCAKTTGYTVVYTMWHVPHADSKSANQTMCKRIWTLCSWNGKPRVFSNDTFCGGFVYTMSLCGVRLNIGDVNKRTIIHFLLNEMSWDCHVTLAVQEAIVSASLCGKWLWEIKAHKWQILKGNGEI